MDTQRFHLFRPFWGFRSVLGILAVLAFIPALVGCGQAAAHNGGDPALPSGWSWYHDTRFPFQVPVPPGWRAGGYTVHRNPGEDCQHAVDVLPPVTSYAPGAQVAPKAMGPEYITISVTVTCPEWNPRDPWYGDPNFSLVTESLTISGAPASLWKNDTSYDIRRAALTRFGGHQYSFILEYDYGTETPASGASMQLALYMQLLQGFKYIGPAS